MIIGKRLLYLGAWLIRYGVGMKLIEIAAGAIVMALVFTVLLVVYINMSTGDGCGCSPAFTVDRAGNATVPYLDITYRDSGGAKVIKNMHFADMYALGDSTPPSRNATLKEGTAYRFRVEGNTTRHIIIYANVDGVDEVIVDTTA